jgi:endonuclease-3
VASIVVLQGAGYLPGSDLCRTSRLFHPWLPALTPNFSMRFALFCGARPGHDARYVKLATDVTRLLVLQGHSIVYGGGNIGLMGAVAEAAIAAKGDIVGIIPGSMVEAELAHHGITRLEIVQTMHQRKARICELADAFIALPGGYGTMDELFEIITWKQLKLHDKPIGLLNAFRFYDDLVAWIEKAVGEGFIPEKRGRLYASAATLPKLLQKMGIPVPTAKHLQAARVNQALAELYPDAHCALVHQSPFQLLIATILSAQCTDKMVNKVTPALFAHYPDPAAFAGAELQDVEKLIQATGFYHNKAKNIIACAKALLDRHGGVVPETLEELTKLPGVGRKTANVVLGDAFGVPGMVVDTHVHRLTRRMGLTKSDTPEKIEQDLMKLFPPEAWTKLGHRLIFHGRQVCDAKKPRCEVCTLREFCPRVGVK